MDEYVQCENCHDIIPIENYNDHLDICFGGDLDDRDDLDEHEDRDEEEDEVQELDERDEINSLSNYLTSSRQIPRSSGGNLRSFLNEHYHGIRRNPNISLSRGASPSAPSGLLYFPALSTSYEDSRLDRLGEVKGIKNINKISDIIKALDINNDIMCAICQEDINKSDKIRRLKCSHLYCDPCISKWMSKNTTCPLCKTEFDKNKNKNKK
jgi:hypothetical protein